MLFAVGWAIVRSSHQPYATLVAEADPDSEGFWNRLDVIDDEVQLADEQLFQRLESFLAAFSSPDLDWRFRPHMNNHSGVLTFSSSRNHRGVQPTAIEVLTWLALNGPGSYGLVYLHDTEDIGDRSCGAADLRNEFRVWRLLGGKVESLSDPFLSPIIPRVNPNEYA
jgi:hypothetical protein